MAADVPIRARDLFNAYPAIAQDMTAAPDGESSLEFCNRLVAGRTPEEAITFCAYLLPARHAIWWAHECLGNMREALDGADARILDVIRDWVSFPSEPYYRQALYSATLTQQRTPAVWIAVAAGWEMEREELGTQGRVQISRAINTGILSALARVALLDRAEVLKGFTQMGLQLSEIDIQQSPDSVYTF